MSKGGAVPDAWDDDWVNNANKSKPAPALTESAPKVSKAQRRAQHAEQQRQLWDGAENPGRDLWLETQGVVPLKQEFQTPVTLLSRKPPTIAKKTAAEGLGKLSLEDEEDSEEEEARKKRENEFQDRQTKAKTEREEKQKRYAEARERIMGSSNAASSASTSRDSSHTRDNRRPRGAKASGGRGYSQADFPAELSPARQGTPNSDRKVFDPDDMGRRLISRWEPSNSKQDEQPLRQPRGPDSSGRGGFGFTGRGGFAHA